MQDPALSPDVKRNPGYSLDALRFEQTERFKVTLAEMRAIAKHLRNTSKAF